jgi:hypothetical protein
MSLRGLPAKSKFKTRLTVHTPAADTAAVVTLAAVAGQRHAISKIDVSYLGTITTAGLTVSGLVGDGYSISFPAAAGFYQVVFDEPLLGDINTQVVVTAADPGNAAGTAKLNVQHDAH